jgi:hypothetical protein
LNYRVTCLFDVSEKYRFTLTNKSNLFLVEAVFNELTELEIRQHLNAIALPMEEREKIKNDVKKLLAQ